VAEKFLAAEDDTCEWYGIPLTAQGVSRGAIDDADAEAVIKPKPFQAPVEGWVHRG
jgi:hypothetical protein